MNISVPTGNLNTNVPATIAASGTVSNVISSSGLGLCGIKFPAGFLGTTVTFNVCESATGTFVPMKNSTGTAISYTVGASEYTVINPSDFQGVAFFEIVSGTAQTSGASLICSLKGL